MALIRPFRGLRPTPEFAKRVAAPPYDVVSVEEAKALSEKEPLTFLRVDKAEVDLPKMEPLDARLYAKAAENLSQLIKDGVLIQDEKPCLYIYRMTTDTGRSQTGLAACVSVEEYENGTIKRHELTRTEKEQDRVNHVNACKAHTGPIFLTFRAQPDPSVCMAEWINTHEPTYCFVADNGVEQALWVVDEDETITRLVEAFKKIPCLYIADGHHRNAAAMRVSQALRAENPHDGKNAEYNFYLSVLFPHDELAILDYNRVVKDLNHLTPAAFLQTLAQVCEVNCDQPCRPENRLEVGLYLAGSWYRLTFPADKEAEADAVNRLAVSILQNNILTPILGITNPQADPRIDFVGGARGLEELVRRVDSGEMAAAFAMYPTSLTELMAVADAGRLMPPKSTWFEPKLMSGLLIHTF